MEKLQKYLPWIIRILLFGLFVLSGVAKMFPIWAFEKQLVDLGIADWCSAPYLARAIIAFELALGIALLQANYLRSIIIPVTTLLLIAFNVHLGIEMAKHGATNGNCGCFGQLIPMTPLEAFIKNILTIGLLVFLFIRSSDRPKGQNQWLPLISIGLFTSLLLFVAFPFAPCKADQPASDGTEAVTELMEADDVETDTTASLPASSAGTDSTKQTITRDTVVQEAQPSPIKSIYSAHKVFGNKKVNLDKGKKIVCLFVPGCDHCRDAAKELTRLGKAGKIPPVYILFMDEEADKIPDFFAEVGQSYPYKIMDIPSFWQLLGNNASTPGVVYLWNGHVMRSFEGTGANAFDASALEKAVQEPFKK